MFVPEGSNEIAVIPQRLRTLELTGALVTIDAAGRQTENARLIREGGGTYVLAAKGHQPTLEEAVQVVLPPVHDAKGRKVDAQDLRKRLKKDAITIVLVSADGRPIDPRHLRPPEGKAPSAVPQPFDPATLPPALPVPSSKTPSQHHERLIAVGLRHGGLGPAL